MAESYVHTHEIELHKTLYFGTSSSVSDLCPKIVEYVIFHGRQFCFEALSFLRYNDLSIR